MERKWETRAAIVVCVAAGVAAVLFGLRYLLGALLPFLLAWVLALLLTPPAEALARRTGISRRVWAVLLLILTLCALLTALSLGISRGLRELENLLAELLERGSNTAVDGEWDWFERLTAGIGWLRRADAGEKYKAFRDSFNDMVEEALSALAGSLSASLPALAGKLIASLPSVLLFVPVTVIAGFSFCLDPGLPMRLLCACLPRRLKERLPRWKQRLRTISLRYLRAYLLILLVTFTELLVGFLILRVRYAFLLSLIIAAVDVLPILGVGTVLIPWAVLALLRGDPFRCFGLLILYAAVTLLRQLVEPRLVGKSLGLHPLAALVASYAGWRWFGVLGMALGPLVALLGKAVWRGKSEGADKFDQKIRKST